MNIKFDLWITYHNGQNWFYERGTKEEVLDMITPEDVKEFEITVWRGQPISKEELCAL